MVRLQMRNLKFNYFDSKGKLYETSIGPITQEVCADSVLKNSMLIRFKCTKKAIDLVHTIGEIHRETGKCFCKLTQYREGKIRTDTYGTVIGVLETKGLEILFKVSNILEYKAGKLWR